MADDLQSWLGAIQTPAAPQGELPSWVQDIVQPDRVQQRAQRQQAGVALGQSHLQGAIKDLDQSPSIISTNSAGERYVMGGDEGAKNHAAYHAQRYEQALTQQFPSMEKDQRDQLTDAYRQQVETQSRAWQLNTIRDSLQNRGQVGFASPDWAQQHLPGYGQGYTYASDRKVAEATKNFNAGKATSEDYGWLAKHEARLRAEGNESGAQKFVSGLLSLGSTGAEFAALAPLGAGAGAGELGVLGRTAPAALGRLGAAAVSGTAITAGQLALGGAARVTTGESPFAQHALPEGFSYDEQGKLQAVEGTPQARWKEVAGDVITNSLFAGLGTFKPEARGFFTQLAKNMAAGEVSEDAKKVLESGLKADNLQGGPLATYAAGVLRNDPQLRTQGGQKMLQLAGQMGLLEVFNKAYERGHPMKDADLLQHVLDFEKQYAGRQREPEPGQPGFMTPTDQQSLAEADARIQRAREEGTLTKANEEQLAEIDRKRSAGEQLTPEDQEVLEQWQARQQTSPLGEPLTSAEREQMESWQARQQSSPLGEPLTDAEKQQLTEYEARAKSSPTGSGLTNEPLTTEDRQTLQGYDAKLAADVAGRKSAARQRVSLLEGQLYDQEQALQKQGFSKKAIANKLRPLAEALDQARGAAAEAEPQKPPQPDEEYWSDVAGFGAEEAQQRLAARQATPAGAGAPESPGHPPEAPAGRETAPPEPPRPAPEPQAGKMSADEAVRRLSEGEAIAGVTAKQAADLKAHYVDGKSYADIAKERMVSKQAVADAIERATENMHDQLEAPGERRVRDKEQPLSKADYEELGSQGVIKEDPYETALNEINDQMMKETEDAGGKLSPKRILWYTNERESLYNEQDRGKSEGPALRRAAARRRGEAPPAEGAERGQPASLRRAAGEGAEGGGGGGEALSPDEAAARGAAGGEGAAGGGEAASDKLEANYRWKEATRNWQRYDNARKLALKQLEKLGYKRSDLQRAKAGGETDYSRISGFDEIAEHFASEDPGLFGSDVQEVEGKLWDFLTGPKQPKPLLRDHLEHVQAEREHRESQQAALNAGDSQAHVEASLRSGEELGEAQGADESARRQAAEEQAELAGESEAGSAGSFDFGGTAGPESARGSIERGVTPRAQQTIDNAAGSPTSSPTSPGVKDFFASESGAFDPNKTLEAVAKAKVMMTNAYVYMRDSFNQSGGRQLQETARLSGRTAMAMRRYLGTAQEAALVYEDMREKIWGKLSDPEVKRRFIQTQQEERFRYAIGKANERAETASNAAADARRLGNQDEATKQAKEATDAMQFRSHVTTHVGKDNSLLKSEADFQNTKADPEYQAWKQRYRDNYHTFADEGFRVSQGLEEDDPIHSWTQMPGETVNLVKADPEEKSSTVIRGASQGNLKNLRLYKSPYANEATLASAYETDPDIVLAKNVSAVLRSRNKAEMFQTAKAQGAGEFGKPGTASDRTLGGEKVKELPGVLRGKSPFAEQGEESFYVPESSYNDWRRTLAPDAAYEPGLAKLFNQVATRTNLISTMELASHTKNISTGAMTGGVRLRDIWDVGSKVLKGDTSIRDELIQLAQANALRPEEAPRGLLGSGIYDPTTWSQRFLKLLDKGGRLVANRAFEHMAEAGVYDKNDANARGDFVNGVMGNYDNKTMPQWASVLKQWGLQPFGVAANTFAASGVRQTFGLAPAAPLSAKGQARYSMEALAKVYGTLAMIPVANYLLWGRADGDDNTPLGNLKVGTQDGKSVSLPIANLFTGVPRAMRQVGLQAFIEGDRRGLSTAESADRARDQALGSLVHLFAGPGPEFVKVAATGKSLTGWQMSEKAKKGQSQALNDVLAAIEGANPVVGTALGVGEKKKESLPERATKLLGPYAPAIRTAPRRSGFRHRL